jgi:hypothetical protein
MRHALTDATRVAILDIKEATYGRQQVHGIDIYRTVLDEGVRSVDEFNVWFENRDSLELTFWRPKGAV